MSRIRANQITNKNANGAVTATDGFNITGVCTATSFSGTVPSSSLSGALPALDGSALTGITAGTSLSGSTNNTVCTVTGANAIQGESSLTYDSTTNKLALTASDSYINVGSNSTRFELRNNNTSSYLYHYGSGKFHFALAGSSNIIQFDSMSEIFAQFVKNGECSLYYDGTKRFETTNTGASVTGDLSVSGALTYEDVTNVDSVGIVTARSGISVTGGVITAQAGENKIPSLYANLGSLPNANTYHGMFAHVHSEGKGYFAHAGNWLELINKDMYGALGFTGALKEQVKVTAGKLSDNTDINLSEGMVHYFTTQETTTSTPNIRFSSAITLNTVMAVGETISVTIITTAAAAGYSAQLNIDGGSQTENWVGGTVPSGGGSSGVDIYTYNIIKTASATFTVIANQTKTS